MNEVTKRTWMSLLGGRRRGKELFRADLISAMKLPDSMPLESNSFLTIKEPWRTEWEIGVQVCVSPDHILQASTRSIEDPPVQTEEFECSQRYIHEDEDCNEYVMYDLDELDLNWLESVNTKRKFRALAGPKGLEEGTLQEALLTLEIKCQQSMARAVANEETLGIEYDEQTTCDVCRDHESEDTNDMIFCDSCNVCVHQACYGVPTIPQGEWLCKACAAKEEGSECVLCTVKGGALKRVRPGNSSWAHLCCALWIPEVRVGNADKMEPITNIDAIPMSRRSLVCCLCKRRSGACIQCSHLHCTTAYHVTCGFQHGLDMKTRLDMATTAVIHESYCPKHTAMRKSPSKHSYISSSSPLKNHMSRPSQLVLLQESFYNYASAEDLVSKHHLPPKLSSLIYNYWKLKRKSQHNRPLLSHLPIETSLESLKAELAAGGIKYGMDVDESFLKIVHLRQNLEKARNLVYMVQRRERLKKQLLQLQLEKFELEASLPLQHPATVADHTPSTTTALDQDRSQSASDLDNSCESDVEVPSTRQTRSMTQHERSGPSSSPPGPSSFSSSPHPITAPLNNVHRSHHHHHHLTNHHSHASPSPPTSPPSETAARTIPNGPYAFSRHKSRHHKVRGRGGGGRHEDSSSDNEVTSLNAKHRGLRRRDLRGNSKLGPHQVSHLDSTSSGEEMTVQRLKKLNSLKIVDGRGSANTSLRNVPPLNSGLKMAAVNGNPKRSGLDSSHLLYRGGVEPVAETAARGFKEDNSLVLRRRTAAATTTSSLRTRPYTINHHKTSNKS